MEAADNSRRDGSDWAGSWRESLAFWRGLRSEMCSG